MRLATLRRSRSTPALPGVHGTARLQPAGADVAALARRLRPGEVAVVDALDLDAASARALVAARAGAVVNAAPSVSGRYPARGAQVLAEAGVALLDRTGPEVMRLVRDGDRVRLDGAHLHRGDEVVARGEPLGTEAVARLLERARAGLAVQLEAFAANTAEHLRHEHALYLDGDGAPDIATAVAGRPVVVVSAGPGWEDELATLRPWLRDADPVLVGVGAGADALLSRGLRPHLVVGNAEVVSEEALLCGAEVVVRADRGGRAPGQDRAEALGARTAVFPGPATDEDAALLLVAAQDAALVVPVGSRMAVVDFVDRARADLAGSFLTRLKVGDLLVAPGAVARLHRAPARTWPFWLLVLVLLAAVVATAVLAGDATVVGQWRESVLDRGRELWTNAT